MANNHHLFVPCLPGPALAHEALWRAAAKVGIIEAEGRLVGIARRTAHQKETRRLAFPADQLNSSACSTSALHLLHSLISNSKLSRTRASITPTPWSAITAVYEYLRHTTPTPSSTSSQPTTRNSTSSRSSIDPLLVAQQTSLESSPSHPAVERSPFS